MKDKNTSTLFLPAKEKSKNDFELGNKMIDQVDITLGRDIGRVRRINEHWHLHGGTWPEMEERLGTNRQVFKENDSDGEPLNMNDFIVHHPALNNVTRFILGGIIIQPLIPIVRDFSAHGRKYREEERLKKLLSFYNESIYAPQAELIRMQYLQEHGIDDPMALNPDEQRQMQNELQARLKSDMPRSIIDDMKKIKTPDEKIRSILLRHDIMAYNIEEKFVRGGEQGMVSDEEYYMVGRRGVKPTIEQLNTKWVRWAGSPSCEYSQDGDMASYEQYRTVHNFILEHGREVIKKKNFMKDLQEYFTEVPGVMKGGGLGSRNDTPVFKELERDFADAIGHNPGIVQNDWRSFSGQQEIAGLYGALNSFSKPGWGIRDLYTVFKWTETLCYVQREEKDSTGKMRINEYFFSADYRKDKTKDILFRKFPISRVYHGKKIANRFYIGVEPVPWQFFGGVHDYDPKLTIIGRRYGQNDSTMMGPAIQYQLRHNISLSKLEELERKDFGKTTYWNTEMRPEGWTDEDYMAGQIRVGHVPYTNKGTGQNKDTKPAFNLDSGSTAKMEEYRNSADKWEQKMYSAMGVNRDAIGNANQYQSNALTQSNIEGSEKQLLPFHNKRRLLKQMVLNAFSNISMLCLIEDKDKQELLLDDFSREHLIVNGDAIKGSSTSIFIVDDYGEAQKAEMIKEKVVSILQAGTPVEDVIEMMDSRSVGELKEVAQVSGIKMKEAATEAHNQQMELVNAQNAALEKAEKLREDAKNMREERKNQVELVLGEMDSMTFENAADVDKNKIADSITKTILEIQSKEKIAKDANETKLKAETMKAKSKNTPPK